MHKARSSQLLPLPTDTEETHEALSAVQVWTVRRNVLVNDFEKNCYNVFLQKRLTVFSSIDGLYVDGALKSASKFFHQLFTIHGLTMCNLHFSYRPINIQRPMRMYQPYGIRGCISHTVSEDVSAIRYQRMYQPYGIRGCISHTVSEAAELECFSNNCLCWLRNRHSQRSDNSVARLGS
jgi:hypothetical protein